MTRYEVVSDAAALSRLCEDWRTASWLALDTEFLREDTYHSQPCLVQVGDGQRNVCIDVIAIGIEGLQPLWDLLVNPSVLKVLHAASQDFEIFVRFAGQAVRPLFDTQVAAALLGDGDQLGYAGLVEKRLGLKLDKSLTRTNWSRRPLSDAELTYAADDVRWLAQLYPLLRDELIARGRLAWLEEDCMRLSDPARYANPPEQAWRRLKGLARLPAASQPIAVALAAWRETQAQERDRPRKWIIDDETIYRMADRRPATAQQLTEIGLPLKTVERHADALLALVRAAPQTMDTLIDAGLLDEPQKALLKRLLDQVKTIADALGIPATVIAPRAEVEAVVRHGAAAHVTVLQGWRREVAGERLLQSL
jgi:ribonuclease D